jgi:hypothetical protein
MLSRSKLQAIKPVKNMFNLLQIKKMLGKKLIITWKGLNIHAHELKEESKKMKKKIMEFGSKNAKKIVITTVCLNGVLNIISGVGRAGAITMISYKEIQKLNLTDIKVVIIQYPKMSQTNIKNLILTISK